jgi:hypothetical protein
MIAIAAQRAPLAERKDDLYQTPECVFKEEIDSGLILVR